MIEKIISLNHTSPVDFWGTEDLHYKKICSLFPTCKIITRGEDIKLKGNKKDVEELAHFLDLLEVHLHKFGVLNNDIIQDYAYVSVSNSDEKENVQTSGSEHTNDHDIVVVGNKGLVVKAKSENQKELVEAIKRNDIVFAVGPAGTGKTFLSVAMAVRALKEKKVKKLIITRPAVEAGENLGYLPGDLKEKVDPYLRPIYDALEDLIPAEKLTYYKENNIIEIAPLAFMRGRTLQNAFVLLDEAQNTTSMQMKMILTRLGQSSKMVITGDSSQIDLKPNQKSGLVEAVQILQHIEGIAIVKLDTIDVVRHKLVKQIITAYENTLLS